MGRTNIKNTRAYKLGNSGEYKVLLTLNTINDEKYNLHNILLKDGKDTHQIDLISITHSGVFVIEVKNVCGYKIYCETDKTYWTYDWIKNKELIHCKLYNPIMQNRTHVQQIRKILDNSVPIHSMVVFANNNMLVHERDLDGTVIGRNQMREYMKLFSNNTINDVQRDTIKAIILQNNHPEISLQEHIDNIRGKNN